MIGGAMRTKKIRSDRWFGIALVSGVLSTVCAGTFTVVNTGDSGEGSLAWAIEQSNFQAGPDTIRFAIPESDSGFDGIVWWIRPKIALPVLSHDSTAILGGSQAESMGDKNPDGPEIALDGTDMPGNSSCLCINSAGNLVSGLAFTGSRTDGITIIGINARGNRIVGNTFGTNPAGTETRPITCGISLQLGAAGNRVGGSEPSEGNLISGCRDNGIYIIKSDSNVIAGNTIGLDRTGTMTLGNGRYGILIANANYNRVGGGLVGERNLISGNGYAGIIIGFDKNTRHNAVTGNFIGTDIDGKISLANNGGGILISNGASDNRIGGTLPGESNLISGNQGWGIYLFTSGTDSNIVEGNRIGTDIGGNASLPNSYGGICIYNGPKFNRIGPSNVIRFNNMDGIQIQFDTTRYNRITQNSISNNTRSGILFFNDANGGIKPPSLFWNGSEAKGTTVPGGIVEIFSDSSGQGRIYEGSVTADGEGSFSWSGNPSGPNITATMTDPTGSTSEFSQPATVTAVDEKIHLSPREFSLSRNFPNPFNPRTAIRFSVKEPCRVVLKVVDLRGREAAEIADADYLPGEYEIGFDASGLASGVYCLRIRMGEYEASRKIVLQK
jgi:parallel beta-helix repeat protein